MLVRRLLAFCASLLCVVTLAAQDDTLDRAFLLLRQAERASQDAALQKEIRVAYEMLDKIRGPNTPQETRDRVVSTLRELSTAAKEPEVQKRIADALALIAPPVTETPASATASLSGTATANVETASGLHAVHFDTLQGMVTVNLPDDLSAGDSISGTVIAEGKGKTDQEKTANQDSLSGYVVEIENQKTTPKQEWSKWVIPAAVVAIPVILRDRDGHEVARAKVPVKPQQPEPATQPVAVPMYPQQKQPVQPGQPNQPSQALPSYAMPSDTQAGKPAEITGSFDGDLATTAITAAGRAVRVLAESPRKAVVQTPPDIVGKTQLDIHERDVVVKCELRTIGVRLSAPTVNMKTGQSTTMTVTVTGLEDLQQPVSLSVTNFTPGVVKMAGGERQSITIKPNDVKGSTYTTTRTLTSLLPGGFNISATATGYGTRRCETVPAPLQTPERPVGQRQLPINPVPSRPATPTASVPRGSLPEHRIEPCRFSSAGPTNTEDNWDFERQITIGWLPEGDAFVNQPVRFPGVGAARLGTGSQQPPTLGGDYWEAPWRNFQSATTSINQHYGGWIGTYDERTGADHMSGDMAGDGATGTLVSKEFTIANDYISFLIGGGSNVEQVGMELQIREDDYSALRAHAPAQRFTNNPDPYPDPATLPHDGCWIVWVRTAGRNSEMMCRRHWNVDRLHDAATPVHARIRIYDLATGDWGHINVDDIEFQDSLPAGVACAAPKPPLFGFVDTHAHPMNHLGFGGRWFTGVPGGNWRTTNIAADLPSDSDPGHGAPTLMGRVILMATEPQAVPDAPGRLASDPVSAACTVAAGPIMAGTAYAALYLSSVGNMVGADILSTLVEQVPIVLGSAGPCAGPIVDKIVTHYGQGYPGFEGYPKFYTRDHQQMHITWIRRAYDGGLRVMSALAGTNQLLEKFMGGPLQPVVSDRALVENEIAFMKRLAEQNAEWMEIAYSPQDVRRIVSSNKLAVILGTEIDGNGKIFADADEEVQWLYNLGVRQVTPIHLANNPLGGNGIYADMYNTLTQFLNRTSEEDQTAYYSVEEACPDPTRTDECVEFRLGGTIGPRALRQATRVVLPFGPMPFLAIDAIGNRWPAAPNGFRGHRNTIGLLRKGEDFLVAMMRRGMLIDVDHMGAKATDQALELAVQHHYPILSSHAGFREMKWRRTESSEEGKWPAENHKTREQLRIIGQLGGFVSPNSGEEEMRDFDGPSGIRGSNTTRPTVANDSAGSSKSFAQSYLYAMRHAVGAGIGIGTDMNGLPGSAGPRFGAFASPHLQGDELRNHDNLERRRQAFAQRNGVAYDVPLIDYRYHRFRPTSLFHDYERDALEALAIATSGTDPDHAWQPGSAFERTLIQGEIVKNYAKGFRATSESQLERGCINEINTACIEQRVAFLAKRDYEGVRPNFGSEHTGVLERYTWIRNVYGHWAGFAFSHANRPLQRLRIPTPGFVIPEKDFDVNIDGFAHYGLFPDFLQDLKNVGLPETAMTKLFNAAEDYTRMWERACEVSATMGGTGCR